MFETLEKTKKDFAAPMCNLSFSRAAKPGGVQTGGGFPDLDSSFLFLSFFVLFCLSPFFVLFLSFFCPFFILFCPFLSFPDFSGIFPICSGMVAGTFPICPFPLSVGNTRVWKPPGLAPLNLLGAKTLRNRQKERTLSFRGQSSTFEPKHSKIGGKHLKDK